MNKKILPKFAANSLLSGLVGFSVALSTCVSAQTVTVDNPVLSDTPLQAQGAVEPNLMILLDSSISMSTGMDTGETRLAAAQTAALNMVDNLENARVGLARFNGSDGAALLLGLTSIDDSHREKLKNEINAVSAVDSTPLAEALADIGRYFVDGYEDQSVTEIAGSPRTSAEILGNGPDWTITNNGGNTVSRPLKNNGTVTGAAIQQSCQNNFILTLTDGVPREDEGVTSYLKDYDGDCDGTDDDNCAVAKNYDDATPGYSDYLDDVAKALYDIDWRTDLEGVNNIRSYFVGFGGTVASQLMTDAASHGRGTYEYAANAGELQNALGKALNSIASTTGTQASVAFNSTSLDQGSRIYSAQFDTSDYTGRLFARALNPDTGRVSDTVWEASEKLSSQSASQREIITFLDGSGVPFDATSLAATAPATTAHQDDLSFSDSANAADITTWVDRLMYLRGDTTNDGNGNYRDRGSFSALEYLVDTQVVGNKKLLGDIVHSTPVYVGAPEMNWPPAFSDSNNSSTYYEQFRLDNQNRTPMVYVGANDGMLHGFNANTGAEVFAYVPSLVLNANREQGLHAYTDSIYDHNYYVDLSPTVSDVYLNLDGQGQSEWNTVLVGGLRGGGKGYFALNITDPAVLAAAETGSNPEKIVLWEFDGASGANNLGYSYSEAQIAKLNNGRWAVIFGNGYNSVNGVAGLFIVYLDGFQDGSWDDTDWEFISTGVGADANGRKNGLSSPRLIDLNGDSVVDRVYAGDLMGNMWAFDLSENDGGINGGEDDVLWSSSGVAKLFTGPNAGSPNGAIMAAPLVARNTAVATGSAPNLLVMFGTGQYLNAADLKDNTAGAFYAVWDNGTVNITAADLANRELVDGTYGRKIGDPDSSSTVALDWATHKGWKIELDTGNHDPNTLTGYAGERVISVATLRRNTLFFSTVSPSLAPCASSGKGYLMSLDFRTGDAGDAVADFNNDGNINAQDEGYVGMTFTGCIGGNCEEGEVGGNPGMPGQSGFIGDVRCTPGSGGDVLCDDIDVGDEEREGRLSWEEFSPR